MRIPVRQGLPLNKVLVERILAKGEFTSHSTYTVADSDLTRYLDRFHFQGKHRQPSSLSSQSLRCLTLRHSQLACAP